MRKKRRAKSRGALRAGTREPAGDCGERTGTAVRLLDALSRRLLGPVAVPVQHHGGLQRQAREAVRAAGAALESARGVLDRRELPREVALAPRAEPRDGLRALAARVAADQLVVSVARERRLPRLGSPRWRGHARRNHECRCEGPRRHTVCRFDQSARRHSSASSSARSGAKRPAGSRDRSARSPQTRGTERARFRQAQGLRSRPNPERHSSSFHTSARAPAPPPCRRGRARPHRPGGAARPGDREG
jgi:hypothetical protein